MAQHYAEASGLVVPSEDGLMV
uniref:DUF982 domain-containing protein n=1 Tax=Heterorhabditis bacteriophora TaxID=37862 RepID=A0A1I7X8S8_HETBA